MAEIIELFKGTEGIETETYEKVLDTKVKDIAKAYGIAMIECLRVKYPSGDFDGQDMSQVAMDISTKIMQEIIAMDLSTIE